MNVRIEESWRRCLQPEFDSPYFAELAEFVRHEYASCTVYPPARRIFHAFDSCPFDRVRAVIIGQDPYHEPGQAHGLCFSVQKGCPIPPSLQNIYKELNADLGIPPAPHGELYKWADNGVLLLNTVLTVREGQPNSHKGMGWEQFTDRIIQLLNERQQPMVFLLWGGNARSKARLITNPAHLVLQCAHPSPLSAYNGFFGCRHFSKTNEFLVSRGMKPIDWKLD